MTVTTIEIGLIDTMIGVKQGEMFHVLGDLDDLELVKLGAAVRDHLLGKAERERQTGNCGGCAHFRLDRGMGGTCTLTESFVWEHTTRASGALKTSQTPAGCTPHPKKNGTLSFCPQCAGVLRHENTTAECESCGLKLRH